MSRGTLRVYLGAAPGVGKTYAMLDEGHRRRRRGTDVVVALAETHGRPHTSSQLDGLEVVPRRQVVYRDSRFEELDLDAVLARRPAVALVDELAHTNVPGSGRHEKRWQDVEELLEHGIDVITTVNVQHLESLNDVVEAITNVPQRETVPDSVVRAAEQVELVDLTPEALRRRMAHGNIYAAEKVDAALGNYFRVGNLTALRELALLWIADSVDEGLRKYRGDRGIDGTWETRERVVVAVTGGPEGETLIRRAARITARASGGELLAVHVTPSDGLTTASGAALAEQRLLVESLGGSYHGVVGEDVPRAILDFARGVDATQIVLGASRTRPWKRAFVGEGTASSVARRSGTIDVHLVSHDLAGAGRGLPRLTGNLTARRQVAGALVAVVQLAVITPVCTALRGHLTVDSDLLFFLLAVVVTSIVGGIYPALVAAIAASLLVNFYFIPPIHTFTIGDPSNVVGVVVFVLTAALVSRVVDLGARRSSQAARARAEAQTLSGLATSLLRGEEALPAMLERVRETFGVRSVSLLRREESAPTAHQLRGSWLCVGSVGPDPCSGPDDGDTEVPVGVEFSLALKGRVLPAEDRQVLGAFAAQVATAYQQRELAAAAAQARPLAETDRQRTALLNAVSHDLRTPLSAAKAAISSLRMRDVEWSDEDRDRWLADAEDAVDRVTDLITSLLDLSRLEAGALPVTVRPVAVEDVIAGALSDVARDARLDIDVPPDLPEVLADPDLLERVVANLVQNAVRYSPAELPVRVAASTHLESVEIRVVDRGQGIPERLRERVFEAFQRFDDVPVDGAGVGLGLAVARGLATAMGGAVTAEETPGGGATLVVTLRRAGSRVP